MCELNTSLLLFVVGEVFDHIQLQAGDDAGAVRWTEANKNMELYASHVNFIEKMVQLRDAAW